MKMTSPTDTRRARGTAPHLGEIVLGGRYRMERRLGGGATSSVWLARDQPLDRAVAVKILDAALAYDQQRVAGFRREARLALRLHHRHLVGGYDWGEVPRPYLVMRYIDGPSLSQIRKRPGGYREDPRALARDLLEALAWLHGQGVIHCDVAPGNVLIASDGSAWLTDFGIARSPGTSRQRSGWVTGTLPYMAPEVRRGWPATVCSDLYATGVVIGECADRRADATLSWFVSALSAINPARRPASAREAASLLDRPAASVRPPSRQARPRSTGSVVPMSRHERRVGALAQPATRAFEVLAS
jgi:eukaryotic-like serine/threonine-protein kinase